MGSKSIPPLHTTVFVHFFPFTKSPSVFFLCPRYFWATASTGAMKGLLKEVLALSKGKSLEGFGVEVRPSSIFQGGFGVFISENQVPQGALVALYPGVWFPAVPRNVLENEVYSWAKILELYGPEAIDPDLAGYQASQVLAYRLFCDGGIMDGFMPERRVRGIKSPFAVGHLVNHRGNANVEILQLDSTGLDELGVSRLHRGLWYLDSTWRPVMVPSNLTIPIIALQAICDLRMGEELFLNYRLRPPYPSWYVL